MKVKDNQGRPVIIFHLKRFWEGQAGSRYIKDLDLYEEIKAGRKTSEFRDGTEYWKKRLLNAAGKRAWFVVGYPKGNLPHLEANIIKVVLDLEAEQVEVKFEDVVEVHTHGHTHTVCVSPQASGAYGDGRCRALRQKPEEKREGEKR